MIELQLHPNPAAVSSDEHAPPAHQRDPGPFPPVFISERRIDREGPRIAHADRRPAGVRGTDAALVAFQLGANG